MIDDLEDSWQHADPVPRWDAYLDGITAVELHRKAKELRHSSAGPDGLAGCEVADLPLRFWELLWERLEEWSQRDEYPQVWRHARTVFLPKDAEAQRGGLAEAARMRPISIFGCIYRVVVSAWTSHERTRAWLQTVAPDFFHGGLQGRAAQQALRRLDAAFNAERVLVSLDFRLCFDHVDPELALHNLALYGAPARLVSLLRWTWKAQHRWLQIGSDVLGLPELVTTSLPQGCPASPVALLLLLRVPALEVQRELGDRAVQSIFVDDRSLVLDTAGEAHRASILWEAKV